MRQGVRQGGRGRDGGRKEEREGEVEMGCPPGGQASWACCTDSVRGAVEVRSTEAVEIGDGSG